ncbi:MAG: hypothetical protein ACKVX9_13245, partial [Blastocatellia bacterium]
SPCRGLMVFPVNSGGYASLHRRLPSGVPSEHNDAPIVYIAKLCPTFNHTLRLRKNVNRAVV